MIKYDKLWVLNKAQEFKLRNKDGYSPGVIQGPVIALTIEELRECFKWGMDSAEDTQLPSQSFQDFLTSKGIDIP